MPSLLEVGLANAVLASGLAVLAVVIGGCGRRPALTHALWIVVLVKFITPPLIEIRIPWGTTATVDSPSAPALASGGRQPPGSSEQPAHPNQGADAPRSPGAGENASQESALDVGLAARGMSSGSGHRPADLPVIAPAADSSQLLWGLRTLWDGRLGLLILALLWLAGTCGWFLVQAWRILRFQSLLLTARPAPAALQDETQRLARALGLRRPVTLCLLPQVVSPMMWAFGPSVQLIFPRRLLERLTPESRATLLTHELIHFRRGDHWVRLLEFLVTGLFWWHPVVWWARRTIEISEEECCDAGVVHQFPETPRCYAEALLETVDFLADATPYLPPTAAGLGAVPVLRHRLLRIMCGTAPRTLSWVGRGVVLLLAALLPLHPVLARPAVDAPDRLASLLQTAVARRDALLRELPREPHHDTTSPPHAVPVTAPAARPTRPAAALLASVPSPDDRAIVTVRINGRVTLRYRPTGAATDLSPLRITCLAFAPDGRTFLTGGEDGALRLWETETGRPLALLGTHRETVQSVAWSAADVIASGDRGGTVKLWDAAARALLTELPPQSATIGAVRFSPDGQRLAIATGHWMSPEPGTISLWDVAARRRLTTLDSYSPAGAVMFHPDGRTLVVGEWNGRLTWRDLPTGETLATEFIQKDRISAAAFSPDCPLPSDMPAQALGPLPMGLEDY